MTDKIFPPVRDKIRFTSPFLEPRGNYKHLGTDFGPQTPGVPGDTVVASTSGTLVHQYTSPTYGKAAVVERDNGDGTYSYFLYGHLKHYDPKFTLNSREPTKPVNAGDQIGQMGNTGSSARGEKNPVHTHFEQITTGGKLELLNGWPLGKGNAGVTDTGVPWERVGASFQLPNGWVATSDNGRMSVTLPGDRFFGGNSPQTALCRASAETRANSPTVASRMMTSATASETGDRQAAPECLGPLVCVPDRFNG